MKKFVYSPLNDKSPAGVSTVGSTVSYTLKCLKFDRPTSARIVYHKDNEQEVVLPMTRKITDDKYVHFYAEISFETVGFYWYHFEVSFGDSVRYLYRGDNLEAVDCVFGVDFLQSIIASESKSDRAFSKGIIYHIFVDRFCKVGRVVARDGLNLVKDWNAPVTLEYDSAGERVNNNCYGGNFAGIIEKLPYLKSLNVGTLYLSPVFEANSSHKYNVADYSKLDSMFGTPEDFSKLITEAKKIGIKIIIDGVFNHTGSDSVYFNKLGRYKTIGAYQSKNSKYFSWYDFQNYPDQYSCWWGIKTMPETREDSGFFDYIAGKNGIVQKYMAMGLGGFRLDVVDELTNNFITAICKSARDMNSKALIVGEVWEDASTKIAYGERKNYFLGGNLDSVTNYPMKNAILEYVKYGNVANFVNTVNMILDQYPVSVQNKLMNFLDTHDTTRALTYLGADSSIFSENKEYILSDEEMSEGVRLLKIASIIQYTVMGVPTVFYGDEAGIQGTKDPYCRAPYPWGKENLELMEWYRALGNLRNNSVLADGSMNIIKAENGVLIYERVKKGDKVIVLVNRSDRDFEFVLNRNMVNFFSGDRVSGTLTVLKDTAMVLV